jgi:hypothetical protein
MTDDLIWLDDETLGVPQSFAGCHLSQVGRYIIEGHVPIDDILRILDEHRRASKNRRSAAIDHWTCF